MKKLLFSLFKKLFEKEMNQMAKEIQSQSYYNCRSEYVKENKKIELFALEEMVGKPIIVVSNEWDNPSIGFATHITFITQSQVPILMMKDYLTNENVMVSGKAFLYNEQKLEAILKLNPFELCSLIYGVDSQEIFTKEKSGIRLDNEELIEQLTKSDFFDDVKKSTQKKNLKI